MNAKTKFAAIVSAMAALLLTGACAKLETGGRVNSGDIAMEFRAYAPKPKSAATRVDTGSFVSGTALPDSCTFGVFAFYQPGTVGSGIPATWSASRTPGFMFNQKVEHYNDAYSYAPERYWPANEENTISFWAYYPYSIYNTGNTGALKLYSNAACTAAYTKSSTGLPYAKYNVPADPAHQYDLLFDSFTNKNKTYWNCTPTPGTVPLNFRHALSWVEFEIIEGTGAVINSMSVTDLYWSGVCTDVENRTWTAQGDMDDFSVNNVTVNSAIICSMIMMPQTIESTATLTVNYDITFESSDPGHPEPITYAGNSGSVLLRSATQQDGTTPAGITAWEPGHHYIYKIRAGFERIEFEEVVDSTDDWSVGNNNISVPE